MEIGKKKSVKLHESGGSQRGSSEKIKEAKMDPAIVKSISMSLAFAFLIAFSIFAIWEKEIKKPVKPAWLRDKLEFLFIISGFFYAFLCGAIVVTESKDIFGTIAMAFASLLMQLAAGFFLYQSGYNAAKKEVKKKED